MECYFGTAFGTGGFRGLFVWYADTMIMPTIVASIAAPSNAHPHCIRKPGCGASPLSETFGSGSSRGRPRHVGADMMIVRATLSSASFVS